MKGDQRNTPEAVLDLGDLLVQLEFLLSKSLAIVHVFRNHFWVVNLEFRNLESVLLTSAGQPVIFKVRTVIW